MKYNKIYILQNTHTLGKNAIWTAMTNEINSLSFKWIEVKKKVSRQSAERKKGSIQLYIEFFTQGNSLPGSGVRRGGEFLLQKRHMQSL